MERSVEPTIVPDCGYVCPLSKVSQCPLNDSDLASSDLSNGPTSGLQLVGTNLTDTILTNDEIYSANLTGIEVVIARFGI
jgi:uncharacterized protein YjbI with pentapeptide repeats